MQLSRINMFEISPPLAVFRLEAGHTRHEVGEPVKCCIFFPQ